MAGERESLERDGYLLMPSMPDDIVVAPMRTRLDELVYQTLVAWDANPRRDAGENGVAHAKAGLPDLDLFDAMLTHDPGWVRRQQFLILGS